MDLLNLDHPIYSELVKPRGYTVAVNIFGINDHKQAAKVLRAALPDMTSGQAQMLYHLHSTEVNNAQGLWSFVANKAAFEVWGRGWQVSDYRISGIGSDEFPDVYKELLRSAAHAQTKHDKLMGAYFELWRVLSKK